MKGEIIGGLLLILFGFFHIFRPQKVAEVIKKAYKSSPFVKSEKQLSARKGFIISFGLIWIVIGLFILVFGA